MEERVMAWEHSSGVHDPISTTGHEAAPVVRVESRAVAGGGGLLPEVVAFQDYLAKHGGHCGGWDDLTHQAFIKLYHKHSGACVSNLPGITLEDAESHVHWYQGYSKLLEAKKTAIGKWKKRKEVTFDHELLELDFPINSFLGTFKAAATKQAKMLEVQAAEQTKAKEAAAEKKVMHREDRKREIEKWKRDRKSKQQAAERAAEAERKLEQERLLKWRQEQEQTRQKVLDYVQIRSKEQALQREREQEAERIKRKALADLDKEEMKRLAVKDAEFVQKKRKVAEARAREEEEKVRRLEKLRAQAEVRLAQVEVQVDRDPARVLQPTEGFRKKLEAPKHDAFEEAQAVFKPVSMPKRQIPTWRKGI
ncbi:hypothetical protein HK104_009557 [Borealophlyctis nickersoniae]|nr:hypothetical protein HK104_009557 [Borealophlyctis nickersoniae]